MNLNKSSVIFGPSLPRRTRRQLQRRLRVSLEDGIWKYLVVKMSGKRLRVPDFNNLVDKVLNKFAPRKSFHLSLPRGHID